MRCAVLVHILESHEFIRGSMSIREMILNDTFIPNKYIYEERIENGKLRKLQKI